MLGDDGKDEEVKTQLRAQDVRKAVWLSAQAYTSGTDETPDPAAAGMV